MAETRTIKGQAWIRQLPGQDGKINYSLVQDQTTFSVSGACETKVVTLIEDIWEDLLSENGEYKTNDRGFFYWEYKMTDIEGEYDVTVEIECPAPIEGLFKEPYDPEKVSGKYAKYWVAKLKTSVENFEYKAAIQKKEIIFPSVGYIDYKTGKPATTDEIIVANTDLGDITNLLGLF